ncbi:outer membrane usher protein [Jeongeupia chitinilytica]|uniref:Outer membrane usher protein n=2 Tax=Jeongeupia chitinilytica TaxID=1041641 RepID=A0ABQ3H4G4_9NEIS|nr:outer membrane usher protein [Jeongeupia chitinilytica]
MQIAAVEFNQDFLPGFGSKIDISRFNKGNLALPGDYRAALYVNDVWIGVVNVALREIGKGTNNVQPVFNKDLLQRMGVDMTRLSEEARLKLDQADFGTSVLLPDLVAASMATFDMGEQRLDVSLPQVALSRNARGWVDPKFWDDGVPAAILQYNANVFHTGGAGYSSTQSYLGLNAGMNAGPWRLRLNGNVTHTSGGDTDVQSIQAYVQRGFEPIKSQLTVGDSFTDGSVFDSFGVRGIQLGTDDRMYPESLRGYAPVVRGMANSNAKVQIKQNGNIIYETTVSPGPFEISDLYATGYGGDLQVVVTEADGSQHISSVPYSSPVNALRAGRTRYNLAAGVYRNSSLTTSPLVFEASAQHGFNNLLTGYAGAIVAEGYMSAAVGAALNTQFGAFGLDVTETVSRFENQPDRYGQSIRASYSHLIAPTNTNLTLAAYRYSTAGFLSFTDAMSLRDLDRQNLAFAMPGVQKGRLQLTLNQSLNQWGSVYLSGYTQNYWNKRSSDTQFQFGYNASMGRVGLGLSVSREYDVDQSRWSNRFMLNLSIPLGMDAHAPTSMTSYTHDTRDGSSQYQESVTGTLGEDNQFNYGVTAARTEANGAGSNNISANAGYLSPFTQVRVNAGQGNGYTQAGGGLSGSVVAWPGGLALTPSTGDSFAVIEAKDAAGARIASQPGIRLDPFGHAVIAGMNPYSLNSVEIDTKGLPAGVQLSTTEQHFSPTAGAVVRVKFDTENKGKPTMLRIKRTNGEPLPFGADVIDASGKVVGNVAQGGRLIVYGAKDNSGELTVKWGNKADQSCQLQYKIPEAEGRKSALPVLAQGECR